MSNYPANKHRDDVKRYNAKMSQLNIRITPEYYEMISKYATMSNLPIRQVIIRSLDEYMSNHPIPSDDCI